MDWIHVGIQEGLRVYNDFKLEEYSLDILTIWWVMPLIRYSKNYIIIKIMSSSLSGF